MDRLFSNTVFESVQKTHTKLPFEQKLLNCVNKMMNLKYFFFY